MKAAFTSDGALLESRLSPGFGRTDYFLIFNTDDNSLQVEINPYKNVLEGAGIQAVHFLISRNCNAIITRQIGNNALRFLLSSGILVYIGTDGTLEENLLLLKGNKLKSFLRNDIDLFCQKRKRKRYGKT
jgi:predicted Fe-Mo cluster-binding NifX family protein